MIIYVDGGCHGNGQRNMAKRRMVAVVTDASGTVLFEGTAKGGSNNIAELWAVCEALKWSVNHQVQNLELRTDSRNNFSWVLGKRVGLAINDRDSVLRLKQEINTLKAQLPHFQLVWVPRNKNVAGHYIERQYGC